MNCPICEGEMWVCENHHNTPWSKCDCGGAGSNCVCNPDGVVNWEFCLASVDPTEETVRH